ncbi:MAG: 4Fe-4S binding protein [Marinifilaceae bacterium]
MEKIRFIIKVLTVTLLLVTIAIKRDRKIAGQNIEEWISPKKQNAPTEWILEDGSRRISSINIAQDIAGFAAATPIIIQITDNKITDIEILKNSETPEFFNTLLNSSMINHWIGLTPQEALNIQVDVVSGATMSSTALIKTIRRTLQYATSIEVETSMDWFEWKVIVGILVIISGVLVSLLKSKRWRNIQLILNVIVLGLWCGSFLSISLLVNWIENGINLSYAILTVPLLAIVLIMPILGRKSSYCMWHCPMGSLQELAGKTIKHKLTISPKRIKFLTKVREGIFMTLLFLMWIGIGFELMNYEVFSFFIFHQASYIVLIIGITFIALSFVIQRPYCRFVCPTGTLFKLLD